MLIVPGFVLLQLRPRGRLDDPEGKPGPKRAKTGEADKTNETADKDIEPDRGPEVDCRSKTIIPT